MSSTENKNKDLEDLYDLLMFKCFSIVAMPVSEKQEDAIMTLEKVDGRIESVYYCQGLAERIEVLTLGTEGGGKIYHNGSVPDEYKGVFTRLQTSFPYRKNLQPLRSVMGL